MAILARFGLSHPASASHKLVFHVRMHDTILANWARQLAQRPSSAAGTFCRSTLQANLPVSVWDATPTAHMFFTAWQPAPNKQQQTTHTAPIHCPWQAGKDTRELNLLGKAQLASYFESYAELQSAVMALG